MVYKPTYNWGAPYCKDVQCIFLSGYHAHSCWLKRPNNGPVVRIKTPFGHLRLDALHRLFRHFRPPRGAGWTPETVGEFGEKHGVVVVEVTSLPLSSHAFLGWKQSFEWETVTNWMQVPLKWQTMQKLWSLKLSYWGQQNTGLTLESPTNLHWLVISTYHRNLGW